MVLLFIMPLKPSEHNKNVLLGSGIIGICPITGEHFDIKDMQADHIIPWWKGGKTVLDNLQMISKTANARKSGK